MSAASEERAKKGETRWWMTDKGYIRAQRSYRRQRPYRHRIVAANMLGVLYLPDDIEVHHINGRPWDCRVENLAVMKAEAHRSISGNQNWGRNGNGGILTPEHLTKEEHEELVKDGVRVAERLLKRMGWWCAENVCAPW